MTTTVERCVCGRWRLWNRGLVEMRCYRTRALARLALKQRKAAPSAQNGTP